MTHMIRTTAAVLLLGLAFNAAGAATAEAQRYREPPSPGRPNFPQRPHAQPRITVNPYPHAQPRQPVNPRNDASVQDGINRHRYDYWRRTR